MFLYIVLIIAVVSVILAIRSLFLVTKIEEVGDVKSELARGKVLYKNVTEDYSSEASS